MKLVAPITSFCVLFICIGCGIKGAGVDRRISKNPGLFHTKTYQQKKLITLGQLSPGMTRDAVYLAWGNPKQRAHGVENGTAFEEWTYQKLKPKANFQLGLGTKGIAGPGIGLDRSVNKVVRFENGRVTGYRTIE